MFCILNSDSCPVLGILLQQNCHTNPVPFHCDHVPLRRNQISKILNAHAQKSYPLPPCSNVGKWQPTTRNVPSCPASSAEDAVSAAASSWLLRAHLPTDSCKPNSTYWNLARGGRTVTTSSYARVHTNKKTQKNRAHTHPHTHSHSQRTRWSILSPIASSPCTSPRPSLEINMLTSCPGW